VRRSMQRGRMADRAAGSATLAAALASPNVSHVTVLSRRAPSITHPKLQTILVPSPDHPGSFEKLPPSVLEAVKDHQGVIWALGVSSTQVKGAEYVKYAPFGVVRPAIAHVDLQDHARLPHSRCGRVPEVRLAIPPFPLRVHVGRRGAAGRQSNAGMGECQGSDGERAQEDGDGLVQGPVGETGRHHAHRGGASLHLRGVLSDDSITPTCRDGGDGACIRSVACCKSSTRRS
jgi:hypothetical protein